MPWIGPKGEAVPPHPRPEPRFEGDLTADRIRWIFRDSADFGERPVLIGGDPAKRTTVFFLNGQVRNERMNDYILRPLATSPLLREATPQAAFRMMTEGIVYTQLVQVCTTLEGAPAIVFLCQLFYVNLQDILVDHSDIIVFCQSFFQNRDQIVINLYRNHLSGRLTKILCHRSDSRTYL